MRVKTNYPTTSKDAANKHYVDSVSELVANKDTTATLGTSDIKYPSQKAVKTYVDTQDALKANIAQEAWHEVGGLGEPAFQNSWSNLGSGWPNVSFMKDTLGFVHFKGLMTGGTVGAYPGSPSFTLPTGYRPDSRLLFNVQANAALGRIDIATDGTVNTIATMSNAWVSLDGIIFKAA